MSGVRPLLRPGADAVIFSGAFGSGKTEVAINYALAVHASGETTCIVDFDVVTPYFRVGDYRDELQRRGLRVVASAGQLASFELPARSPEVNQVLSDASLHLVLDVGGDPEGARLLRTHAEAIAQRRCQFLIVVNPFRPTTSTVEAIVAQSQAISAEAALHLTGLVANPNLGPLTRVADVVRGMEEVRAAATALELPVVMLALSRELAAAELKLDIPVLPLDLVVRLPWQ